MPTCRAYIDQAEITGYTVEGSVTHQHNRPSFATVRLPTYLVTVSDVSRLRITLNGTLDFHGLLAMIEDQSDPRGTAYTTMTFVSPSSLFEMRPSRDADGDFSKPSFIETQITGPQIVQEILTNSLAHDGALGIQLGTFAPGGANLSGAPADFPISVAAVVALLGETGELDVVETPIDSGGNMALISAYNGDYGADRTSSVRFGWKTGNRNIRDDGLRRAVDFREICNKLWIYLGPRVGTKLDPAGDQHWAGSITGGIPGEFPDPPASAVFAKRNLSRTLHYTRMQIRIMDADGAAAVRDLYERWWLMESWLRAGPKTHISFTPQRGIAPTFRTGDLIWVEAASSFRGGFAGPQRIMEYTYRWDASGVIELGAPVAQSGAPAVVSTYDTEGI